jgi:hypothetical protein
LIQQFARRLNSFAYDWRDYDMQRADLLCLSLVKQYQPNVGRLPG